MNPFDVKAALLAKHAQHVVLIHFPIALLLTGVAFDAASQWTKRQALAVADYYNLSVAAASTLPVVATGLLAWQWQLGGHRPKGTLLLHLVLGAASGVMICLVWWQHEQARRHPGQPLPAHRWPLQLLAVALVTLTGHLGGFLSGVNAPG
jgi:uncharacterized membrane protein